MKCKKILVILLILLFMVVFFVCSYFLLRDFQELKESNKATENLIEESIEISQETQEKDIDWNYLKLVNEDIIAWIEIEGTKINYPILKDKDVYYLNHSYDKKHNSNGSIFTTNSLPFEDEETVVYGHNMKTGTMFSDLNKYLDKEFLKYHTEIKIYTPISNYIATIISVYYIDFDIEFNNIKTLDYSERITYYKENSYYKTDFKDNITNILKLSTCSYINTKISPTNQRLFVIASLEKIKK